jgi:hypothetical protein
MKRDARLYVSRALAIRFVTRLHAATLRPYLICTFNLPAVLGKRDIVAAFSRCLLRVLRQREGNTIRYELAAGDPRETKPKDEQRCGSERRFFFSGTNFRAKQSA